MVQSSKIKEYIELIEKVAKVEQRRIPSHMVEYEELVSIGTIAIQTMIKGKTEQQLARYNNAYIATAVRWAIRNELRHRYKWYTLKNKKQEETEFDEDGEIIEHDPVEIRAEVYKNILSIDELQDAEVPTQIKSEDKNPEESIVFSELKKEILVSMEKLPPREKEFIECKFFKDKKLREIADEFNISQSRISRIIQSGLDKIKKDLAKQGII